MKNGKFYVSAILLVMLSLIVLSVSAQSFNKTYLPMVYRVPSPTPAPTPLPTIPPVVVTGNVSVTGIFFDGTGQNEPDEYVVIKNVDTNAIQLQDWTLRDNQGWTFTFPTFAISPNQECRIYTNEYHPESCGLSFGKSNGAIWNNTGDCAFLRNSSGTLISQRCY